MIVKRVEGIVNGVQMPFRTDPKPGFHPFRTTLTLQDVDR